MTCEIARATTISEATKMSVAMARAAAAGGLVDTGVMKASSREVKNASNEASDSMRQNM